MTTREYLSMAEVAQALGISPDDPQAQVTTSRRTVANQIGAIMPFEEHGGEIAAIVSGYLPHGDSVTLQQAHEAANRTYSLLNEDHLRPQQA